ncbi:MAG: hypothetical protein U0K60_09670 [Parafannyhessea umbonata]|nr:hypothetical protein [Parafannyhessea umbonata]
MTATERLRALLTERGVEWRGGLPTETMVEADGLDLLYVALPDGRVRAFIRNYITPEQAIEATLGDADATGERQRDAVEVVRCRDCKRFSLDNSDHDYRSGWWCHRWYTDMVKPDGFCAWGERRESE